jgi:aarF domain-containing kinase
MYLNLTRVLLFGIEKVFDIPVFWSADYIAEHIRQELDFVNEGRNAEKCDKNLKQIPSLADTCYVPKVYWDLTTPRILTCEFIEGVSLNDLKGIKQHGFNVSHIMDTVVKVFADQIFRTGFIHCDPHPGNILIRKKPNSTKTQVVLLDHGLYITSSEKFRKEYCLFWKSLFILDSKNLSLIANEWGIPDISLFATATLARPWSLKKSPVSKVNLADVYQSQQQAKTKLVSFLENADRIPRELMFVGRNLNCVRANNKFLGSPVNRINIMAYIAASSLDAGSAFSRINYYQFRFALFLTSFIEFVWRWTGLQSSTSESALDFAMKAKIEQELPGVVIDDTVFNA